MIDQGRIEELRHLEFSKVFRGYEPKEVDEMVSKVVVELSELLQVCRSQGERLTDLESRYEELKGKGNLLSEALLEAHKSAETFRESARKEADQIVREAEFSAREIVARGEERRIQVQEWLSRTREEWLLELARIRGELQALFESLERFDHHWQGMEFPAPPPLSPPDPISSPEE
ncbi:MAG: DivIVA domain-containing protein [Leptospirales bacterium]